MPIWLEGYRKRRSIELDLAALLVSRQRAGGHICLPLHEIAGQPLPAVYRGLELAPEADDWIKKLQGTDVVGRPGEFKPLILDEQGRLYLRRYWEYEKRLADIIKSRLKAARPAVNAELLRQGLETIFPEEGRNQLAEGGCVHGRHEQFLRDYRRARHW